MPIAKPVLPATHRGPLALAALLVVAAHALLLAWPQWRWTDISRPTPTLLVAPLQTRTLSAPAPPVQTPPPERAAVPTPALRRQPARRPQRPARAQAPLPVDAPQAQTPDPGTEVSATSAATAASAILPASGAAATMADAAASAPAAAAASAPAVDASLLQWARAPAQLPASLQLDYQASGVIRGVRNGARGTLDWQNSGDGRYQSTLSVQFLGGLLRLRFGSEGRIGAHGLRPDKFSDTRRGTTREALFARDVDNAEHGTIRFSNGRPATPLLPGAQDYVSVVWQLAGWVQAKPEAFTPGKEFSLQAAGPNSAAVWRVRVEPGEALTIGGTSYPAIKLRQLPAPEGDRSTEIWLVATPGDGAAVLPGRIRLSDARGDYVELLLRQMPGK